MDNVKTHFVLLLFAGIWLSGCASSEPIPVSETRDLVFASGLGSNGVEWKLDMVAPDEAGDWPAVLFLPGWSDTKGMMAPLARSIAEQGAIVYVIDYPRIERSQATFNYGSGYRQLAEITACAVRYARSKTADPDSLMTPLVLAGVDYGAGVAAHVALYGENVDHRWEEFGNNRGGPRRQVRCAINQGTSHVDALVGVAGDYEPFVGYEGPAGREFIQPRDPALWALLNSAIGENPDLTVYLLHSRQDSVVPYESAANFMAVLSQADYDVTLENYDGDHTPTPLEQAADLIIEAIR